MSAKHSNAPDFSQVMASDRHRLQQQFQRLPKDDQGKAAATWLARFEASSERVNERNRLIPKIISLRSKVDFPSTGVIHRLGYFLQLCGSDVANGGYTAN